MWASCVCGRLAGVRRISSFPNFTLPTENFPAMSYSKISTVPKCNLESPRPTCFSTLVGVRRTDRGARECERRKALMSGNPEASVSGARTTMGTSCAEGAAICATEETINAAPATARGGPGRGGVAPVGLLPPRPAPPNPYCSCASWAASPPTAGAAFLPLPLPLFLPFLPFPAPFALPPGVPFSESMMVYSGWPLMVSGASSE
jgi:hypothetical protein